jgi:flagellar hook-length control protein FliK
MRIAGSNKLPALPGRRKLTPPLDKKKQFSDLMMNWKAERPPLQERSAFPFAFDKPTQRPQIPEQQTITTSRVPARDDVPELECAPDEEARSERTAGDAPYTALQPQLPVREAQPLTSHVESVEAPRAPAEVRGIQSVAGEILYVAQPNGVQEVHIQLNSTTFEGLQIRVDRSGAHIAVRFTTASMDVARLLERNVGELTAALAARGLDVQGVRVVHQAAPASESTLANTYAGRSTKSQSGDRNQRQGGRNR